MLHYYIRSLVVAMTLPDYYAVFSVVNVQSQLHNGTEVAVLIINSQLQNVEVL